MAVTRAEFSALEHRVERLETWSGPGQAVALADAIKATGADVKEIKKTLGRHEKTLNQHTKILDQHTETLDQHTKTLDQHTETLDQHTKTLDSHGDMLRKIMKHFGIN